MTKDMRVKWENIRGDKFTGTPIDLDNGTLMVRLDNGKEVAVMADGVTWLDNSVRG